MSVFLIDLMWLFAMAVCLGVLFRMLGLPSLVGQVAAGFLVGLSGLISPQTKESLPMLGSLGVTLLLFLVGLEMNLKEIKKTGMTVLKFFSIHTLILFFVFVVFSVFVLKQPVLSAVLLSVALTFSSTIVVVRTLSEKKDLQSYAGKMSIGVLLLQDLLAIFLLVLMSGFNQGFGLVPVAELITKMVALFLVIDVLGGLLISQIEKHLIKSSEDLVLISLVWFGLSVYLSAEVLGLTPEIGGILAGISLSSSWGRFQIVSKVKTIRDIFLTVFFVILGLEMGVEGMDWWLVGELVLLAVLVKFMVGELVGYVSGLSGKVTFVVSLSMTQLSEFSLIVMAFGLTNGFWSSELSTAVTVAGLISMVMSTILIGRASALYKLLSERVGMFKFLGKNGSVVSKLKGHVVLLGGDRTGRSILATLLKNGERVLVVDFNQDVVSKLSGRGVDAVLADASDPDIVEVANLSQAKFIISTVKDIEDTLALLSLLRQKGIKVPTIVDAESAVQAATLYGAGASYVIFPHFVSGLHLGSVLKKFEKDVDTLKRYRQKQNETLKLIYEGEF